MSTLHPPYPQRLFTDDFSTPSAAAISVIKRISDVVIATALLLFLAPLLLFISAVVMMDSPGPALFWQRRTGLHGQTFRICKFRTMTVMEDGKDLHHARQFDSRVTRVGRFLRRTHLDEFPQLINVLKGEMAFIGPRPHALAHDRRYGAQFTDYADRFRVRPGLTGLAQVEGYRGEVLDRDCLKNRLEADLRYVAEWTLSLDLVIALRTVPLLFHDTKAY